MKIQAIPKQRYLANLLGKVAWAQHSRRWVASAILALLPMVPAVASATTAGDADATFGTDGFANLVADRLSSGEWTGTYSGKLIVQPDGKFLVAANGQPSGRPTAAVIRANADGSLDDSFGTNGVTVVPMAGLPGVDYDLTRTIGLALDSLGRVIVTVNADQSSAARQDMVVIRLTSAGIPDATFGNGGRKIIGATGSYIGDPVVTADGDFILPTIVGSKMTISKYDSNWNLASGFTTFTNDDFYSSNAAVVSVLSDGSILVGGYGQKTNNGNEDQFVYKLNADGTRDTTFGDADTNTPGSNMGFIQWDGTPTATTNEFLRSMVVLDSGLILVSGSYSNPSGQAGYVGRLTSSGQLDTTFGTSGWASVSRPADVMLVDSAGRIIAGGRYDNPPQGVASTAVTRLTSDGTIDATFGDQGTAEIDTDYAIADMAFSEGRPVALLSNTSLTRLIPESLQPQTITVSSTTQSATVGDPVQVSVTLGGGSVGSTAGEVSYQVVGGTASGCAVSSSGAVTATSPGTCEISASVSEGTGFESATTATNLVISFAAAPASSTTSTVPATTTTVATPSALVAPDGAVLFEGVGPELEPGTGEILEGDSWEAVSARSSEVGSELVRDENEVVLQPVNDDGSPVADDDFEIRLSGDCSGADCSIETVTDANGVSREVMHLQTVDGVARATGSGFQPGTEVKLWLFSDPVSLGTAMVESDGTFTVDVPLDGVTPGEHTLQANGVTADLKARTAHVGVVLDPSSTELPATGGSSSPVVWAVLVVSLGLIVMLSRRRPQVASSVNTSTPVR